VTATGAVPEKTVSRETSRCAHRDGDPFYARMFHVKHRRSGPENTILQNNPMH
jgi:hypothetical protein